MKTDQANSVVLAIDIGNSRTKLALVNISKLACTEELLLENDKFNQHLTICIDQLSKNSSPITGVNISSCIRDKCSETEYICRQKGFPSVNRVKTHDLLPVTFRYSKANDLGCDRISDSLACNRLFPGQNCLIIDSGTAITIDFLSKEGIFHGGAILPGVITQLKSLNKNTDLLPQTELSGTKPAFPGSTTEQCIQSGVLYGTAGAIKMHIDQLAKKCDDFKIICTGGGWRYTESLLDLDHIYRPDLTLIGTALYQEMKQ
ncbi:Pantothenate kinase [Chitinispirillum alkaliphilum]|nr:Pantothenate kinase [Chitinispirillum alkaliphilum]